MGSLFEELKRRKVIRVAVIYAVVAWVLIQVADTIAPLMNLPESAPRLVLFLLIILFPIALFLAWAYEVTPEGVKSDSGVQASTQAPAPQSQRLIYATFVLVLLAVGFQVADRFVLESGVSTATPVGLTSSISNSGSSFSKRTRIPLGPTVPRSGASVNADIALSPDGRRLAYLVQRPGTQRQLYVQELDQLEARVLFSSADATNPYFSPDGEWIGIHHEGELHKISIRGGQPQSLENSTWAGTGGFWSAEDSLFYATNPDVGRNQLQRINANGGVPEPLEIVGTNPDFVHSWPTLLPDGNTLLITTAPYLNVRNGEIGLLTLATGEFKTIIRNGYNARYVPSGHIVFIRDASLWAVSFDLDQLEPNGIEVPVIQGVQTGGSRGTAVYAFSNDGQLVYLEGVETQDGPTSRVLVWVDQEGNEQAIPEQRDFRLPAVSPDERQLAVVVAENGNGDIWTYDLARNALSRLTVDSANDSYPLWTPNGERIVFSSDRRDGGGLWWREANGTGQAEPLITGIENARPYAFTPDGVQLVYEAAGDLFLFTLDVDTSPQPLIQTEFNERKADISSDGRWIAYESDETGQPEIYVRPFPDVETGKWQISNEGGQWPKWSANGRELFFRVFSNPDSSVWAVRVDAENDFQYEPPNELLTGNYRGAGGQGAFDISNDGSRFILIKDTDNSAVLDQTLLVAVENWFEELKRLAPPDPQ